MHSRMLLVPALAMVVITLASCGTKSTAPTSGAGTPTGPSFNLTFPATGTSQSFTFVEAGSWAYHCNPHGPGMSGTVVVDASAASDSALVTLGPSTLTPRRR